MNKKFNDFGFLETLSIEIGPECNLKKLHSKCPAHIMERPVTGILPTEKIVSIMDEAVELGFNGYFAFHFYNEPLLYVDRITEIIRLREEYKYLLWSNGTLVKKLMNDGFSFDIFDKIVFTNYEETDFEALKGLQKAHKSCYIYNPEMDNRLEHYECTSENYFACKKPYVELPIDCYGNVYICTYDWDKRFSLGSINEHSLEYFLKLPNYQEILNSNIKHFVHGDICGLCKNCPRPFTR